QLVSELQKASLSIGSRSSMLTAVGHFRKRQPFSGISRVNSHNPFSQATKNPPNRLCENTLKAA
ncbi:hypothetical protein, partial [Bacillus paramycoides]|uniref:hypothetical protein n=1 Tax=Bacillus paramycoides TaxID=2026194 RepID=UPI003D0165B9